MNTSAAAAVPARRRLRASLFAIVAVAALVRLAAFLLFPYVITEDSNAYLLAAEFLSTRNPAILNYLTYRQLGYPGVIMLLGAVTSTPILWLILLQITVGSASCALIALISERGGVSRPVALAMAAWYALYSPAVIYSTVVAPETLLVGLALGAGWLMVRLVEAIEGGNPGRAIRFGISLGATLGAAAVIRETFLIMAALAIAVVAVVSIARRSSRAAFGALAAVMITALSLELGALATSRTLLGSTRLRPYAFPWAISLDCYYIESSSPPYPALSARLAPLAAEHRRRLASWDFQLGPDAGYRKGNLCVENGVLASVQAFIRDELKISDPYLAYVKLEEVLGAAAVHEVPRHFAHYVRWWFLPEVLRGLVPLEPPRRFDAFRHFTTRELEPAGQLPALAAEIRTAAPYAPIRSSRATLQWAASEAMTALTFQRFWLMSVLFLGGGWFVVLKTARDGPRSHAALYGFLWIYAWATIAQTAAIVWFYERYTMYVVFAYLLVAGKLVDILVQRGVGRGLVFRRWSQDDPVAN